MLWHFWVKVILKMVLYGILNILLLILFIINHNNKNLLNLYIIFFQLLIFCFTFIFIYIIIWIYMHVDKWFFKKLEAHKMGTIQMFRTYAALGRTSSLRNIDQVRQVQKEAQGHQTKKAETKQRGSWNDKNVLECMLRV